MIIVRQADIKDKRRRYGRIHSRATFLKLCPGVSRACQLIARQDNMPISGAQNFHRLSKLVEAVSRERATIPRSRGT